MIIEADHHLYQDGQYVWTPQRAVAAWSRCFGQLRGALASCKYRLVLMLIGIPGSGKSTYAREQDRDDIIIFDSTFVDATRRERVVSAARAAKVPITAIWLDTDFSTCLRRNHERPQDRRVPADSMRMMLRRLTSEPPRLDEGFGEIYRISA